MRQPRGRATGSEACPYTSPVRPALISTSHSRQSPMGLKPPAAANVEIFRAGRSGEQTVSDHGAPFPCPGGTTVDAVGPLGRCDPRTGSFGIILVVGRLAGWRQTVDRVRVSFYLGQVTHSEAARAAVTNRSNMSSFAPPGDPWRCTNRRRSPSSRRLPTSGPMRQGPQYGNRSDTGHHFEAWWVPRRPSLSRG
jgi:hypothetical protein